MKTALAMGLAALAGPLAAHPHRSVDQQVHIALGPERAEVSVRIVPSASDGDVTREVLDLDQNGQIDDAEAEVFRNMVINALEVVWNGAQVTPENAQIRLAPLDTLTKGLGQIELTAEVPVVGPMHTVEVEMLYDGLGADWFIQPFFFDVAFIGAMPHIQRTEDQSRIMITAPD